MTRVLEVGDEVGRTRINSLHWTRSRGWRATDAAGTRYWQYGPGSYPDGLHTRTETGVTLSVWPPPEETPRKPMRRVSPTNKRWNAPGRARPDEPLADDCQAAIEGVCAGRPTDRHHIIPRGPGSSDEAWNTLDVDGACHARIHSRPEWAREVGFLRRAPLAQEASRG